MKKRRRSSKNGSQWISFHGISTELLYWFDTCLFLLSELKGTKADSHLDVGVGEALVKSPRGSEVQQSDLEAEGRERSGAELPGQSPVLSLTDPVGLGVEEEVGPVWVGLHVSELKQLPQAQDQDLLTDLKDTAAVSSCGPRWRLRWRRAVRRRTSFLRPWDRSVALSSGKPGTSVVVRTCLPLSSSITSGTQKKGWSFSSCLKHRPSNQNPAALRAEPATADPASPRTEESND